jgi:hypothetical protein
MQTIRSGSGTYAPASQAHVAATLPYKTGSARVWVVIALAAIVAMGALAVVAYLNRPQPFHCSPPQCGTAPPLKHASTPLAPSDSYTSSTYGFTLDYPHDEQPTQTTDGSVSWSGTYNEGPATWQFTGDDPNGRSPEQIVNDVQQSTFPDATFVYAIPGADIGYAPGYGAVYDLFVNSAFGQSEHQRLVIIAAIKNGTAVIFYGTGPFTQTSLKQDGHPNPAETPLVHEALFRQAIESVTWKGQPPL